MNEHRGGLRIPVTGGMSASQEEDVHKTWDTIPEVEAELTRRGIGKRFEPEYECPFIEPGSLITLSSHDYSTLYEKLLGWYGYIAEILAWYKSEVLQSENEMKYVEVVTKKNLMESGKKVTVVQMNLAVESNPRYIELKLINQKAAQLAAITQGRLNTIEANLKTVSRHIEIRRLEQEGNRTSSNIPNRGQQQRVGLSR